MNMLCFFFLISQSYLLAGVNFSVPIQ